LNKLVLPGRVWVASDIHLGPDAPATAAAFSAFLTQSAQHADTLILAGDIFDAWIGDDVTRQAEPWLYDSLTALKAVATQCELWIGRGNRDFLIGGDLIRQVGARALPEPALLDTAAGTVLLAHGDEYCTADAGYQRFRRLVRNRGIQRTYLSLPLALRRSIANWARRRSMASNQYKCTDIMDVTPAAIEQALRRTDASVLIHGHTHRPARHALTVNGRPCERLVIPDWDYDHAQPPRGGWIQIDQHGIEIKFWAGMAAIKGSDPNY